MWPAIQMMLSRKSPNSVTASHERTKHMFSGFGNVMRYYKIEVNQKPCPLAH